MRSAGERLINPLGPPMHMELWRKLRPLGIWSWFLLGLGLACYIHDRVVEESLGHLHPGLHGMDVGVIGLALAWIFAWIIITYGSDFWLELKKTLYRFIVRIRH